MIETEIASFGGAVVLKVGLRKIEIRGGTERDRTRAEHWVRSVLVGRGSSVEVVLMAAVEAD